MLRFRAAFLGCSLSVVLSSCAPKSPATHPGPAASPSGPAASRQDAAVYAVVLDTFFNHKGIPAERYLLVVEVTELSYQARFTAEFWAKVYGTAGADSAAIDNLERRGRDAISLRPIGQTISSQTSWVIQFVSPVTLDSMPKGSADYFWEAFYKAFPNALGVTSLSAVGYNRSGDRAIMFISHGCHSVCGSSQIVTLRRDQGHWRIIALRMSWVS